MPFTNVIIVREGGMGCPSIERNMREVEAESRQVWESTAVRAVALNNGTNIPMHTSHACHTRYAAQQV